MTLCCTFAENMKPIKKKPLVIGILKGKRVNISSQPSAVVENNKTEKNDASTESTTWGMDEMRFVGEVIREDFVKPLSTDIVNIHQNIVGPLHNGCFRAGFAREANEVDASRSSNHEQDKYEKDSQGTSTEKADNTASRTPISFKKTYSVGIRRKGIKKIRKNDKTRNQSKTRVKKHSNPGSKSTLKARSD
eukprot:scaffold712_cov255-Chaetoceros_neogracile.AAC.4